MAHREGGVFKEKEALVALIAKHGVEETSKAPDTQTDEGSKKRDFLDLTEGEAPPAEEDEQGKKKKKPKAVTVEENRAVAEAILEMGAIYFKNGDVRKGG